MSMSVLIGLYGNYPNLSLRAVRSAINDKCKVYVGMNDCCRETVDEVRRLADLGKIEGVVESRRNLNKDPMMRVLLELVDTPFVLWLDDDSHLLSGWDSAFKDYLDQYGCGLDAAGSLYWFHRSIDPNQKVYEEFCRKCSWFVKDRDESSHIFPMGALWLARTAFLRLHDFPDRAMIKKMGDILLGELVLQQKGRLLPFTASVMNCIVVGDDRGYGRRGGGEEGWKSVDLKTGEP